MSTLALSQVMMRSETLVRRSTSGMIQVSPGPLASLTRPSRNSTPLSSCVMMRTDRERMNTTTTTTATAILITPSPLLGFLQRPVNRSGRLRDRQQIRDGGFIRGLRCSRQDDVGVVGIGIRRDQE